jgi:hypothetical protein
LRTPATVAALVRSTVTGARPLLLPSGIPNNWSARTTLVKPAFFDVTYSGPGGTKSVEFALQVPNPPPPGPHGASIRPNFHGDGLSVYQVLDTTQATSPRWMIWNEPGIWSEPNGLPGVPYFLYTTGLTDREFWDIANSLAASPEK